MNVINVGIDFKHGICQNKGISVVTGDYNSTKVVFEFADEIDGTKIFEMKNPNGELVYADEIVNNEVVLVGYKEENGEIETYSLFGEEGDYIFEVSLYGNDSKLTSVSGYINAKKEEVIVDGEEVQEKITLFDNLINTLNEKIEETDNLDIEAEKVDKTTTITLTKKDGTPEEVEILDGVDGVSLENIEIKNRDLYVTYGGETENLGQVAPNIQVGTTTTGLPNTNASVVNVGTDLNPILNFTIPKGEAGAIKMLIVNELPATGEEDTIYLVPLENPTEEGNNYAEYVYINNQWELLGKIGVQVDLTDYYTKTETNTLLNDKVGFSDYAADSVGGVIKVNGYYDTAMNNGNLYALKRTYSYYTNTSPDTAFISKGTLENVIAGKGLVSNTDYAGSTAGVIKTSIDFATSTNSGGFLVSASRAYSGYQTASNNMFISKGTLENVIAGKGLTTKSYVDGLVGNIQTLLDNLNTGSGV